jgi:hypothetical protein
MSSIISDAPERAIFIISSTITTNGTSVALKIICERLLLVLFVTENKMKKTYSVMLNDVAIMIQPDNNSFE